MKKYLLLFVFLFADFMLLLYMLYSDSFLSMVAFYGFLWLTIALVLQRISAYMEKSIPKEWLKKILTAVSGIVEVITLLCVLVYCLQDVLIFHPNSDPGSYQYILSKSSPEFSKISFSSGNKIYNGIMKVTNKVNPAQLIIFFIGNGQNAAQMMRSMDSAGIWASFLDYNCLIMDYPGYGLNNGRPSANSIFKEALLTYDYASGLPYVDENQIIIGGYSIGTGAAAYLAANRNAAGLFLLAPFANSYDLYNSILPIFYGPLRLLVKHRFLSNQYSLSITSPVLIIASESDEIVPFSSSENLKGCFPAEPVFISLSGVMHNGVFNNKKTLSSIQEFLKSL